MSMKRNYWRAQAFAADQGLLFLETSAVDGFNVALALDVLISEVSMQALKSY